MEKSSYTFNFNMLPKRFLAMLAMVSIFESANIFFDDYFYMYPFEGLRMKIKNEVSQAPGNGFDILAFGDCYNLVGVIPQVIEKETGFSCFNFSTHLVQTVLPSYCMLRNYLRTASRKPKYIIVEFLPGSLAITKDDIERESLPYLYEFIKGNEMVFIKEFGIGQAINLSLPSLKHQYFFNDFLKNLMSFSKIRGRREIDGFIKQVYIDKGYYAWRSNEPYKESLKDNKNPAVFSVSPFFNKYFNKFLDLAKKDNIRIVYLMPSTISDWYERDEEHGLTQKYKAFIAVLKKEHPDLIILNTQHILNDKSMYVDQRHLNERGARALSEFISIKINELSNKK